MRISGWSSDVCPSDLRGHWGGKGRNGCCRRRRADDALDILDRETMRANLLPHEAGRDLQPAVRRDKRGEAHAISATLVDIVHVPANEIGRASCRERVCQYV